MTAMKLSPHVTRYTIVTLLAATLLVGVALALGHSGLLPYEGQVHYRTQGNLSTLPIRVTVDVVRGLSERLDPAPYIPISPDGRYEVRYEAGQDFVVDTVSGARQALPPNAFDVSWSLDSTRLTFTASEDGVGSHRMVFLANADGSGLYRVTSEYFESPRWSPDSRSVLVTNQRQLYGIDATTGEMLLLADEANEPSFDWSFDGSQIAFITYDAGIFTVQVMNADGSHRRTLLRSSYAEAQWSPVRNELLIGVSQDTAASEIYVADLDSDLAKERPLVGLDSPYTELIEFFWWHPEGDRIFLLVEYPGRGGLVMLNSITGRLEFTMEGGYYAALSPDGERLAFTPGYELGHELCTITMDDEATPHCIWQREALYWLSVDEWLP